MACEWAKKLTINYFMNFIATCWCWWIKSINRLMIVISLIKLLIPRSLETSFWHKYFNFCFLISLHDLLSRIMMQFYSLLYFASKTAISNFFCVRKLWDFCVVNYLLQQFYLMMSLRTFFPPPSSSFILDLILSQCKMCEVTEFIFMVQAIIMPVYSTFHVLRSHIAHIFFVSSNKKNTYNF